MTARTANNELRPSDTLDIAPGDSVRLGLGDGQMVRVKSRY
jgi:formate dehydrogenase major subunit